MNGQLGLMLDYYSRFSHDWIIVSKALWELWHKQKKINVQMLNQEVLLEILLKFQDDLKNGWSNSLEKNCSRI